MAVLRQKDSDAHHSVCDMVNPPLGSADLFGHREERSDVAIQSLLILLAFWIASLRSQ
jgi:hypothetical protein